MKKLLHIILILNVCNLYAQHEMMLRASQAQFANEGGGSLPANIVITYPISGQYPDSDFQEWYFFPTQKGHKITFTVNSIDTEAGFDLLKITEFAVPSLSNDVPILQTYSGSSVGTSVSSSIGFRIVFVSDGGVNGNGFTFTIAETADGSLPLSTLTYPASGNYPSGDFKSWYFQDGTISFSAFNTENVSDYLHIYEVNGNIEPTLINAYSGTSLPSNYSNTKRYIAAFTSDAAIESTGFSLTFTPN